MNWQVIRRSFFDELDKIAEVNLSGLSPESVMKGSTPPPPMETAGFSKARDIIGRAQMTKESGTRHVKRMLPTQQSLGKLTHQGDDSKSEKAKSVAGYGAAGAGLGTVAGKHVLDSPWANKWRQGSNAAEGMARDLRMKNLGWGAMVAGTAGGLAYGLHRQKVKSQQNATEMTKTSTTPGTALKASQQTAKPLNKVKAGPSLKTQTPGRIGSKGGIP